jgi:tRNA threonylcarbamoyladenosine biosynthesis protein TsaE
MKIFISKSPKQTQKIAKVFARILKPGDIVGLEGDLAAGKTVFIKGIANHLGIDPKEITSTSFILIKEHKTRDDLSFFHADLYRINSYTVPDEFYDIIYDKKSLVFVEWSDRIKIPLAYFKINIEMSALKERRLTFSANDKKLQERLKELGEIIR